MTDNKSAHATHSGGNLVIAIDGPSGSGKSSVSKALARRMGAAHLDTGAMYRAATLWCLSEGLNLDDPTSFTPQEALATLDRMELYIATSPDAESVRLGNSDVTEQIRSTDVSTRVSAISTIPAVREKLIARQRELINSAGRIVVEGRDITTVVAPEAHGRILLTAAAEVRMARRGLQLSEADSTSQKHSSSDGNSLREEIVARDARDSAVVDFMNPAEGVALVDSTHLTFEDTVEAVLQAVHAQLTSASEAASEGETRP